MNEINELLKYGESEKAEFKKSTAQLEKGLKAVCGFLNHSGGSVYFGIHEGKVVGQEVSDSTLRSISQKIRQNIKPEVSPEITVLGTGKEKVIQVRVKEGLNKLYYLNGIAYKRVGAENIVIPPEELERIILNKRKKNWDFEICEDANLGDIDWEKAEWFKERYEFIIKRKIHTSSEDLLKSLNCLRSAGDKNKPTNAGVLLFGNDPQKFFPNTRVTIAVYLSKKVGTKHKDIRDFQGCLLDIIDETNEFINKNINTYSYLKEGQLAREDISQYPPFVLRELLVNAVAHRDYTTSGARVIIKIFEDRIEYQSPGPLPAGITPENILKETSHRNPVLMKVLNKIRYVEEVGEGWDRIMDEIESHPLHPAFPKIEDTGASVIVTIFSPKDFESFDLDLNDRQRRAIEYARKRGNITKREYMKLNEVSARTAHIDIKELFIRDIFKKIGVGRATKYTMK
ncbi:hypothetical protein BEH94_01420 [Candidatus Altiarchaeales archaeon WOR_SM1_SCG]|nr:hypothetical protein BEH94_01420 [Candidatus Altiarchaeales archaeon WOR_SM1_SCG]